MKHTEVCRRLLGYLKIHWAKLIFVIVSAVISTGFMVFAPFLIGKITTTLFFQYKGRYFLLGYYYKAAFFPCFSVSGFPVFFVITRLSDGKNHGPGYAEASSGYQRKNAPYEAQLLRQPYPRRAAQYSYQ